MNPIAKATAAFRRLLWVMAFFSLFTNLLMLAIPLYMLQIYDRVLPSQSASTLTFLSIIAGLALLCLGAMEAVRGVLAQRTAARLDAELAEPLLRTVIRQGSRTVEAGAQAGQPLRDLSAVRSVIASRQAFALLDLPFALVFIAILYVIHPHLFWITLGGAVLLAIIAMANLRFTAAANHAQGEAGMLASQQSDTLARNSESIRAMGMVTNTVDRWGGMHASALQASDSSGVVNSLFTGLSRFIRLGLQIVILGWGAVLTLQGEMTAGMIFASSIVAGRALQPIDQVIGSWRQIAQSRSAWKRLSRFLSASSGVRQYMPLPAPAGNLEASDIFVPNESDATRPVLNRVSFRLEAGKTLAVIGASGSGKSTLARVLVGALPPRAGTVRIDGNDVSNWDPEALGRHVGYLAQEVELLPGTIAENIARFDPHAPAEAILEAARRAHAAEIIKAMPQGFDTVIGPGGLRLSGGERQRIALARAFYGRPRILVLDEPNSSLDRPGEGALNKALEEAAADNVTVFIITQREPVLARADFILRLQQGSVADYGPRDEIIRKFMPPQATKPGQAGRPAQSARAGQPASPVQAGRPAATANPQAATGRAASGKQGEARPGGDMWSLSASAIIPTRPARREDRRQSATAPANGNGGNRKAPANQQVKDDDAKD